MRHFKSRHGGLSGAALAFLLSVGVLAGLLVLMLGGPGPLAVDSYRTSFWRAVSTPGR
jgi:hypothetical protein